MGECTLTRGFKPGSPPGWVQYGDTKVGFVLVVLGLGLANLADASGSLIDSDTSSRWGLVARGSYWLALTSAALAVFYLGATVLPYAPRPDGDGKQRLPWPRAGSLWFRFGQGDKVNYKESPYYFRDVASRESADVFHKVVSTLSSERLIRDEAFEVYGLAKIAEMKVACTKWALLYSACFLLLWLIAKAALALSH